MWLMVDVANAKVCCWKSEEIVLCNILIFVVFDLIFQMSGCCYSTYVVIYVPREL